MSKFRASLLAAGIVAGCNSDGGQHGFSDGGDGLQEEDGSGLDGGPSARRPDEPTNPDGGPFSADGGENLDGGTPWLPPDASGGPIPDGGTDAGEATLDPSALPGLSPGCVGVRYAKTSDRIYLEQVGSVCSPRDIALSLEKLKTPVPPGRGLVTVDAVRGIYYLTSNLFLRDGAKLNVRGIAAGGDTNELRLKSLNSAAPDSFVYIRAEHGDINLEGTRVTSWDEVAGGPDLEYETMGRAFVSVRSWLDPDGVTPHESRMDIIDSEVSYLGYFAAEAYGLTWKVSGAHTTPSGASLFDLVNIHGDILNSNIHHNYFGVYTYGAYGVLWDNNEVHHNVKYGLDPHDDSDTLVITNNFVHDNGNHGIICSRRCDNLRIANNISQGNTGVGIFLHGFVTDSVVEDNQTLDNTNAGIALFDSHHNTIRRNILLRNQYGVRLSVGSSHNTFDANEIGFSTKYAIYFYQGTDLPVEGDGRPKRNTFSNNSVHDGAQALKMTDADDNTFRGNTFGTFFNRHIHVKQGLGNVFDENAFPLDPLPVFRIEGVATAPCSLTMTRQGPLELAIVGEGTGIIQSAEGQIYSSLFPDGILVDESGSKLSVANTSAADLAGEVAPLSLFVTPSSVGSASVKSGVWAQNRSWTVTPISGVVELNYRVGELVPEECYSVRREGAPLATLMADVGGFITFTDTPRPSGPTSYVASPDACP